MLGWHKEGENMIALSVKMLLFSIPICNVFPCFFFFFSFSSLLNALSPSPYLLLSFCFVFGFLDVHLSSSNKILFADQKKYMPTLIEMNLKKNSIS